MSNVPPSFRYTEDHEWLSIDGDIATVGITDHAQDQLGDIVYLGDFPDVGDGVEQGDVVGVVESVKASSDIYTPVTGEVVEVNEDLDDSPELANTDPYDGAWLFKVRIAAPSELDDLLDAAAYKALLEA